MAGEESRPPGVRVRGIYATALTQLLQAADGVAPADPSAPIDRRFDISFEDQAAVTVTMTDDRQGVGITGPAAAVETVVVTILDVGLDTFSWPAEAPRGAIFEGEIVDTNRGGAVVELGKAGTEEHGTGRTGEPEQGRTGEPEQGRTGEPEQGRTAEPGEPPTGFLPFGATEDYLDVGDTVRVQVHETHPPWADEDPVLGTEIRVEGDVATLVRGVDSLVAGTPRGAQAQELARTTELLSTAVPENWGVRWETGAAEADMAVLDAALETAVETATDLEEALEAGADAAGPVASQVATTWIWFGRASRFAMDERRGAVTRTMAGHHRIKAGSEAASTAVDFVERLDGGDGEFPFGPVTEVFGPTEGDTVTIAHGKPDGRCFTLGRGTVTEGSVSKERLTVTREISSHGTYDALGTTREPGDVAISRFGEGRWWYPTLYRGEDGTAKGTYVNVATPIEIFPRTVRYVDLHVDVIKSPDGAVDIVDEDELSAAVDEGHVSEPLADKAMSVSERVVAAFEED